MKRMRVRWLVITAFMLCIVGFIGVVLNLNRELIHYVTDTDFHRYDPPPPELVRYEVRDHVIANKHAMLQINTNGGAIHVHQSVTDKIELVLYVPYQPQNSDMPLIKGDGTTFSYDSAEIWKELTGNVSQPIIDIDISVPAGTSLEIHTSMSDITLDATLAQVKIDASFGTLAIPATQIERIDATYTVGGKVLGNAPQSSNITLIAGDIDLNIDQAGSHTMRVTRGNIALAIRKSLHVTTTQSAPNGAFYSQIPTTTSAVDVHLYLGAENGNITLIPRQ